MLTQDCAAMETQTVPDVNFSLTSNDVTVGFAIPNTLIQFAEQQRASFQQAAHASTSAVPLIPAEIVCLFMSHIATLHTEGSLSDSSNRSDLIRLLWNYLHNDILAPVTTDIHTLAVTQLSTQEARQRLINTYYTAQHTAMSEPAAPTITQSALIRAQASGEVQIHGLFGGQGNTKTYFDEIRTVVSTYDIWVRELVDTLSGKLKALRQVDAEVAEQCYPEGLDVALWLAEPESTPSADYLITAPVSFPLIGVLQLAYVRAICMSLGGAPADADFSGFFQGLAGHSQGVVVAAAVAAASNWDEFLDVSVKAVTTLFWIGARSQQVFSLSQRESGLTEALATQLETDGYGKPSPMLSVGNMQRHQLDAVLSKLNKSLPAANLHAHIGLVNSSSQFVVSGPERTLAALIKSLETISIKDAQSQNRIPFSQRKPCPSIRFLPITIPCHCPLLSDALPLIDDDLKDVHIMVEDVKIPVNQSRTDPASSLMSREGDLVPTLVRMVTTKPVQWTDTDFSGATHILDLGPGATSGVGALTHRNIAGSGTRVIIAGKLDKDNSNKSELGSLPELFSPTSVSRSPNWAEEHRVSLIQTTTGPTIASKLSRLLGLPPFMVAGMTPTTTHPEFVAAVMKAGYHIEFAAGGYHDAESLRSALSRLRDLLPPGRTITLNIIYVSPKAIAWQIPLIRQLRSEGFPLTGLTVGGGVPSPDVAAEYIATLGVEHISFKPGSAASIRQVVDIARRNASFPVILQWTGGRGGGHHSAEDMDAPILETYAEIRACANISLVAGSGFGCARDVIPYLTGTWSLARGKQCRMPFDGALFGSRVMASAEALTSLGAKQAIADAPGVRDERDWEGTYRGPTGGVISVVSEMGEPMHVVATRGARFWAEMDKIVFSLDKKKRPDVLAARKDYIISHLNADFQRPWFARKTDGTVCDISDMTYDEVARRLLELMFVNNQRWIDQSYVGFLHQFLQRIEERCGSDSLEMSTVSEVECRMNPSAALEAVLRECPQATSTLLFPEDEHYFIQLCRRPGQKPVPFVPALDSNFETWFKKDSLWQSEDVEAVVGQDAARTLILHGPVATRYTTKVNEPVAEILDGINNGVIEHLRADIHGDEGELPFEEFIQSTPSRATNAVTGQIDVSNLTGEELRALLTGSTVSWKTALLNSRFIFRGRDLVENPIRRLFDTISVDSAEVHANSLSLFTKEGSRNELRLLLKISEQDGSIDVLPFTYVTGNDKPISMHLQFEYHPEAAHVPIWEVMDGRNERICAMYQQLWSQVEIPAVESEHQSPDTAIFEDKFTVDAARVAALNRAIGYNKDKVPLDFCIVASWSPICKALLQSPVQGDVLNLVHLSNAYERTQGVDSTLKIGEDLTTSARVNSITIENSGKIVEVLCELRRPSSSSTPSTIIATVRSKFLFRGAHTDFHSCFAHKVETPLELKISNENDIAVLASKPWFRLDHGHNLDDLELTHVTLEFHLTSFTRWLDRSTYRSLDTTGRAYVRSEAGDLKPIGVVNFHADECRTNAVLSYLHRCGRVVDEGQKHELEGAGAATADELPVQHVSELRIPASNEAYSRASGDFNPIHTSPMFAELVNLPGVITHGMYCSAAVRRLVEKHAAGDKAERVRKYDVSFVGMVLPNDVLEVSLRHTGMQAGLKHFDIQVTKQSTGEKVLLGSTLIAQPPTTVVFTGQGSQEKGMGMDLYASSTVARSIWDKADAYFMSQFGLSILDIVRHNPKEIKVHFGGVRGRMLRQNYLSMYQYETSATTTGTRARRPIFPTVNERSASYTHSSSSGLLFATQFAQPALTIMEMAAFKDMQARGVVDKDCHFAGHSLGEYAALASITDFMSFEDLLYLVFCRGMTMQGAVDRDEQGRSAFSMVAVDPSRVSKDFTESSLGDLVSQIQHQAGFFIEIVNLNIRNGQYVCAGDLRALDLLQRVCDAIKALPSQLPQDAPSQHKHFQTLITQHAPRYAAADARAVQLQRGAATVPLTGVDVPFHSSFLRPRMEAFRNVLHDSLNKDRLRPERLVGKYVPNVTGRPFEISREYFEEVLRITESEKVREVLEDWDAWMKRVEDERVAAL